MLSCFDFTVSTVFGVVGGVWLAMLYLLVGSVLLHLGFCLLWIILIVRMFVCL